MKALIILGSLVLLASCVSSVDCAKDLTKPLSSCPVTTYRGPQGPWIEVRCGSSKVIVRRESYSGLECYCLENRFDARCD